MIRKNRSKKTVRHILFTITAFLLVATFVYFYYWWGQNSKPFSNIAQEQRFVIPKGYSASQIALKLEEQGLIRNSLAFRIYVQLTDKAGKIQAGEFNLSKSYSLEELVSVLQKGPEEIWVTIPEGLRKEQIALVVMETLGIDDPGFYVEMMVLTEGKEGYLFPDTYLFSPDVTPVKVVEVLEATFAKKTGDLNFSGKYSFDEIIIMASIIERETKTSQERPVVSGILWKRLEKGWSLEVDASVQYAIAGKECPNSRISLKECGFDVISRINWWPILTRQDLQIQSSYNTYKNVGLPRSPIACPGLVSIEAAANPVTSNYWFYIHDKSGEIHYAETIEKHNLNISKFLKK